MTHFLDTMTVTELEEMERKAYAEGDTLKADLLARVAELEKQVEALEDEIGDLESKNKQLVELEYKTFFEDCFEMLNGHYPAPSVTSDYDKSVIFDAIRLGEETREETEAKG